MSAFVQRQECARATVGSRRRRLIAALLVAGAAAMTTPVTLVSASNQNCGPFPILTILNNCQYKGDGEAGGEDDQQQQQ